MPFKNAECDNLQFLQGYFTEVLPANKTECHAALTCEQAFSGNKIEKTIERIYLRQS